MALGLREDPLDVLSDSVVGGDRPPKDEEPARGVQIGERRAVQPHDQHRPVVGIGDVDLAVRGARTQVAPLRHAVHTVHQVGDAAHEVEERVGLDPVRALETRAELGDRDLQPQLRSRRAAVALLHGRA